jgi:hypothetical protein
LGVTYSELSPNGSKSSRSCPDRTNIILSQFGLVVSDAFLSVARAAILLSSVSIIIEMRADKQMVRINA